MKNIVMVHDYPPITGGGLEVNTFALSKELVRRGYRVTIASTRFKSAAYGTEYIDSKDGVEIVHIQADSTLATFLSKFDVVYLHLTFSVRDGALLAGELAVQQGIRVLATMHTAPQHIPFSALGNLTDNEREDKISRLLGLLNQPAVGIIVATNALKSELTMFGVNNMITVINFGVEQPSYEQSEKAFDIMFVGRVSYLKGISYLFDALHLLKNQGIIITCGVIGDGAELPLFKALSTALGLNNQITFLGFIEEKAKIYSFMAQAKLLVLPSLTEVFPQVMLEAQHVGTPVVASDIPGITEHFAKSDGGVCFNKGNAYDLTEKLKLLLQNDSIRNRMGALGKEYCAQYATIQEQTNQIEKILGAKQYK